MQSPVVLILFAVVNIVYVSSIQHNDHSNVYDIRKINKVEKHGFVTKNNTPAEFLPWREEFEGFDALEKISIARRKREAAGPLGVAVRVGVAAPKGLKKAYDAYKGAKKARDATKAATQGKKAVDKVLKGTKPSGSNKRKTTFEHKAQNVKDPFKDANKRFDSAKSKDVKPLSGDKVKGRTGKVGDHTITVRDKSTSGEKSPTVEIFKTDQKRRITHKVRHEKPVETPKTSGGKKPGGGWWGGVSTKKSSGSSSSSSRKFSRSGSSRQFGRSGSSRQLGRSGRLRRLGGGGGAVGGGFSSLRRKDF